MQERRRRSNKSKSSTGGCRALCCSNCRASADEAGSESSGLSDRYASISSLAHYMVQERLDQMIKESEEEQARRFIEARKMKQKMKAVKHAATSSTSCSSNNRRLLLMLAMEKSSDDPREDFRRSMVEVILANHIKDPKDLRYILKCYISMNSVEYRGIILEVFYQIDFVATSKFEDLTRCSSCGGLDLFVRAEASMEDVVRLAVVLIADSKLD